MKNKKKNEPNENLNGLSFRHVAGIVRRMMITRDHGDKKKYTRKDKSWKKDL